jgi:hypothetical protein
MESPMRGWLKNLTKSLALIRYLFTLSPLVQVTKLIFLPKDVVFCLYNAFVSWLPCQSWLLLCACLRPGRRNTGWNQTVWTWTQYCWA